MRASISRIKLFKACRRAYYFKYVENLQPVQRADALEIGSNYHEMIEKLYRGEEPEPTFTKEGAMFEAYKRYLYPKLPQMRVVEEWYEKEIGAHELIGKIDGLTEDGVIVEHKTTSADTLDEYEYRLQWDEQTPAYMSLTGARKALYAVVKKPTIRQKKAETDEEFYRRMVEWYDEDTDEKIRLFEATRTDGEIERFEEGFGLICGLMEEAPVLYGNALHCNCWNRPCEYMQICLNYDPDENYVEFERRVENAGI